MWRLPASHVPDQTVELLGNLGEVLLCAVAKLLVPGRARYASAGPRFDPRRWRQYRRLPPVAARWFARSPLKCPLRFENLSQAVAFELLCKLPYRSQFASKNVGPSWFDIFSEARSDRQAGTASVITLEHFLNLSIQRWDGARYALFLQSHEQSLWRTFVSFSL